MLQDRHLEPKYSISGYQWFVINHNVLVYWNNEKETNLVKTNKASWHWPNDRKVSIQIPSELCRAEMSSHIAVRTFAN